MNELSTPPVMESEYLFCITRNARTQRVMNLPVAMNIPMRDGVRLRADVYFPPGASMPLPAIVHLTPYVGLVVVHKSGSFFAANDYAFVSVSCRGCGTSEGVFELFAHDGRDGYDAVEWVAEQAWSNGQVAMWGGSYAAFTQWATVAQSPPHLATIVPKAAAGIVRDYPMTNNIVMSHLAFYCNFVDRDATLPESIDGEPFSWRDIYYKRFMSHRSFASLDSLAGCPSRLFQNMIEHATLDDHWQSVLPRDSDYGRINIPVLTITGHYDGDQRSALMFYKRHCESGNYDAIQQHHLVFGPWNHSGACVQPKREFAGLDFGEASVVDLRTLELQWYDWVLRGKTRPDLLKKRVLYFVEGSNCWKTANNLRELETTCIKLHLRSSSGEATLSRPGELALGSLPHSPNANFVYDPLDTSPAEFERSHETVYHHDLSHVQRFLADQDSVLANTLYGNGLVYESERFENDVEVTGNLRVVVWVSMDVRDTDFQVCVYEIGLDQSSIILTDSMLRARYRKSLTTESLVVPGEINRYEFDQFQFFARQIRRGSRIRLIFQCVNSMYWQKNYNSGGIVATETADDVRTAHVTVHQNSKYPSFLELPIVEFRS